MEESFKIEIVGPEKILFQDDINIATIPSYEGDMGILKNHISIITFLRPGLVKIQKNNNEIQTFFVEDGVVEFFNNKLIILSTSAVNIKDISRKYLDNISKNTEIMLSENGLSDDNRYLLSHKLEVIKEINV